MIDLRLDHLRPFDVQHGIETYGVRITAPDEYACYIKGRKISDGVTLITGVKPDHQPDPSRPPVTVVTLKHTDLLPDGRQDSYSTVHEYARLLQEPDAVFSEHFRPGTFWDNKRNQLLSLILIASDSKTAHRAPVMTEPVWMDNTGWYDRGKRIADAVEVVGEYQNQWGELRYRIRTPRENGSENDFDYLGDLTWEQLQSGSFTFGSKFAYYDSARAFMALWGRWTALSTAVRQRLDYEDRKQAERDATSILANQLRMNNGRLR